MGTRIFRLFDASTYVGCVVASTKKIADAYALGKYGPGTSSEEVSYSDAVELNGVCVLAETRAQSIGGTRVIRALVRT